jgi:hypothetical protein
VISAGEVGWTFAEIVAIAITVQDLNADHRRSRIADEAILCALLMIAATSSADALFPR